MILILQGKWYIIDTKMWSMLNCFKDFFTSLDFPTPSVLGSIWLYSKIQLTATSALSTSGSSFFLTKMVMVYLPIQIFSNSYKLSRITPTLSNSYIFSLELLTQWTKINYSKAKPQPFNQWQWTGTFEWTS